VASLQLIDYFERGVGLAPDAMCFVAPGIRSLTYRETSEWTHRVANGLRALGVEPGAHVGLLSANHVFTFVAVLGILRAGAIWVPVNARNAINESINVLANLECEFLFIDSTFSASVEPLRTAMPNLKGLICVDAAISGAPSLEAWASEQSAETRYIELGADDVVAIRGTGGTTGMPKAVPNLNRMYNALFANWFACLPIAERPIHLVVAPLTHAAGTMTFATLAYGGTNVIAASAHPDTILSLIEEYEVSQLFLPPTVIYKLLASPAIRSFKYGSLKYFVYSAAPMSVHKLQDALDVFGPVMVQLYGQAEAPFVCTCLSADDHINARNANNAKRLSSCGRPAPFVRVEVMDAHGALLAAHKHGEIVVKGELVMDGYYRDPEASQHALRWGWLHTGDIGYKDEDGYFYIVDRLKDLIISGGFNISPGEIEQVLLSHGSVADCAVVGVPDDLWGEAVKAVVEVKPGVVWNEHEVMAFCRTRLGNVKAPKSIEVWEQLPRSQIGKVLKKEIRRKFWAGLERQV
jgi:acyl-CoA synthetase (AMP-forming)/AMP-acid ligase II